MDVANLLRSPMVTAVMLGIHVVFLVLVTVDVVHPLQLAYSTILVFEQKQYWRLITSFFFLGKIGVDSFFALVWFHTTSSDIEEEYFSGRPLDYVLTILSAIGMLLGLRVAGLVDAPFLSGMLSNTLLYMFSRSGPNRLVDLLAIFEFRLRLLPAAFAALTIAFNGFSTAKPLLFSYLVGHILWYFLDVFPRITGFSPFRVQRTLERLITPRDHAEAPAPGPAN